MNKRKILIIEDTKSISEELSTILGFEDYLVVEAKDGNEGLEFSKKEMPDLIISDILMPGIDGFMLKEMLRENVETANIPFIFFSAKVSKEDIERGMQLGVEDFVTKPFLPEDLIKIIKKILV